MKPRHLPLLAVQRELVDVPRGFERFRAYLDTMLTGDGDELRLPLTGFNPMSKDHVRALLDELIALDAEAACAAAVNEAAPAVDEAAARELAVGVVVVDDLHGGWTHRTTTDLQRRTDPLPELARGFATVALWSSEPASLPVVRRETFAVVSRAARVLTRGKARTLRELLAQETEVGHFCARFRDVAAGPALDDDDLAYTRQVLAPLLDRDDWPTLVAALYGDDAARALGHRPLGLSTNAGLALACAGG